MSFGQLQSTSNALAADGRTLNALKLQAGQQTTPEAIKEAAKQFESLFMRELIKSMREATMKSGLMDSPGGDLGADLLDQQFAVQMSGRPGGLSDLIAQQLSRQMGLAKPDESGGKVSGVAPVHPPVASSVTSTNAASPSVRQAGFVQRHSDAAARIAASSGIPASFMIGQAGHETGWGKHEIKMKGGEPSFNLFGIKADAKWTGKTAEVTTTEVTKATGIRARIKDYARLITDTPRYAQVRQQTGSVTAFASGLQRAGYATDPAYASKLSRAINTTLQLQRAQA